MSGSINVILTLSNVPNAARVPLEVAIDDSPASFRSKASAATKIPLDSMRLIFRGRLIGNESDKTVIEEYKLEMDSVIHCMGKPIESSTQDSVPSASTVTVVPPTVGLTAPPGMAAAPTASSIPPTLAVALTTMQVSNSVSVYLSAVQTLQKILSNIANNPMEEKYRKVKQGNAAFNKRLGGIPGGEMAMIAVGFSMESIDGESFYVMHPRPENWPKLVQHRAELENALASATNAAAASNAPMSAGIPLQDGLPAGMPAMSPDMQRAAAQMMSNPQQLQAMLQDPMVQNMLRNDPRLANNPMMQQAIEQLSSNPQMLAQVSQMMQTSNAIGGANFQQAQAQGDTSSNNGPTDQEMTEEEMLEEAIRRSLMDN